MKTIVRTRLLNTASASAVAGLLLVSTGGLAQGTSGTHQGTVSLRSTAATHVLPPNLGRLNAAHAVLTGHTQGAPEATVSQLYAYQQAKGNARDRRRAPRQQLRTPEGPRHAQDI